MSKQSDNESKLLTLIYRETNRVTNLSGVWQEGMSQSAWAEIQILRDDFPRYGVRIFGGWLGSDPTSRKARSRALTGLEKRGLVTLHALHGENITHAKLTAAGLECFQARPATAEVVNRMPAWLVALDL